MEITEYPDEWIIEDKTKTGEGFSVLSILRHYSNCCICHYASEADANLIVSAPDMLNALIKIKEAFNEGVFDNDTYQDILLERFINPAIAKATSTEQ